MFRARSTRGLHRVPRRACGWQWACKPSLPRWSLATLFTLSAPGVTVAAPPASLTERAGNVERETDSTDSDKPLDAGVAEAMAKLAAALPSSTFTTELRGTRARAMPDLVEAYSEGRAFSVRASPARMREMVAFALFGATRGRDPTERGPLTDVDIVVLRDDETARVHVLIPRDSDRDRPRRHEWRDAGEVWVPLADFAQPGVDYTLFKRDGTQSLSHQWARREVVEQLVTLARAYRERTGARLGIGDLSQLFGGKLPGHWTHRRGVDVDVYLLDDENPVAWCHAEKDGVVTWTREPGGKGDPEPTGARPGDDTASRLAALAQLFVDNDDIAYLVHDASSVLAPFDEAAHARKPGRHVLHLRNRLFWPSHPDHAHLRWHLDDRPLPEVPRP